MFSLIALYFSYRRPATGTATATVTPMRAAQAVNDRGTAPIARAA